MLSSGITLALATGRRKTTYVADTESGGIQPARLGKDVGPRTLLVQKYEMGVMRHVTLYEESTL